MTPVWLVKKHPLGDTVLDAAVGAANPDLELKEEFLEKRVKCMLRSKG